MSDKKEMLSIVIPVYNVEQNIPLFYEKTKAVLSSLPEFDYEFVFTDNRSTDGSFLLLKQLAARDSRVKVARFSRNFGYQKSIFTAYCLASGDAVIQMDCDLQDPPELILDFVKKWKQGYEVVYGIRRTRREGWLLGRIRRIFYRLIDFLSDDGLPHDAGDFRLVSRKVVDQLRKLYDASPYIRGTIAAFGFNQTGIEYDRLARQHGESKFRLGSLMALAMDGILNHSLVPLRLASFTGFLIAGGLVIYLGILLAIKFLFHQEWPAGFITLSVLILISITLNAIFLGIIGEYLGRVYRQVKNQPMTIIDEAVNL
ncbi:MAG: glycosyltransferase family 2 protein [Candidatus Omnitrophica bacterium]|nr:glycosyltransferase family 2 protein [Candidatus Omnitrophota bacterium]